MKQFLFILLFVLLGTGFSFAQTTISGSVKSKNGEPIPGVNIVITGTTNGTVTDINGNYSLPIGSEGVKQLTFSFIGFQSQTVDVKGKSQIDVTLVESFQDLDEVVVVGYGTMKKSDLTGSVSSVKIEPERSPVATVDQLLQGKASGVFVSSASAEPGASINVRIRGLNSLSVSNQPLYVVDGIPFDVDINTPNSMGASSDNNYSPLVAINPADIEAIEILKDASATAIYGSRGANGVVLITTKGGKNKASEISFSSSLSVSNATKHIDVLSPQEYAEFRNDWETANAKINGEEPDLPFDGVNGPIPSEVQGYNWQDELLRTAFSQDYNLALSGSNKDANYYISFGATDGEGIVLNSGLKRYSFNGKLNWKMSDKLKYSLNTAFSHSEGQGTSTSGDTENIGWSAMSWMLSKSPISSDYDTSEDYIDPEEIESATPLTFVNEYTSIPTTNSFRGNFSLDYEIVSWLTFETKFGLNYAFNKRGQYWPKSLPMVLDQGRAGYSTSEQMSYTWNNLLHFNIKVDDHKISGVAGIETNQNTKEFFKVKGDGFADDDLSYYGIESASIFDPADLDKIKQSLFSVLARANYSYKNKYFATVTGRYDGSSKFSSKKKYGFFPSFSLAWRTSKENFLKDSETISNLKLRFGWGQVGNQGLPPYNSLAQYAAVVYPLNGASTSGYAISEFEKDITWETTEQINAGVDFGMFDNRLSVSVDVYKKLSKDILIQKSMPLSSGYATAWTNLGEIENKGFDLELNTRIIDKKFKWDLGGNFSLYRNKIQKLGLPESSYGYSQFWGRKIPGANVPVNTFIEGKATGLFWGYKTDGIFQTQDEIDALNKNAQDKAGADYYQFGIQNYPGDLKYADENNDGIVNEADKTIIGNPNPDFTYGINSKFSYSHFSLDLFITGVHGVDVFNQNLTDFTNVGRSSRNVYSPAYKEAWTGEGTTNRWPRLQNDWQMNRLLPSDLMIEDGSYVRLQTATLSYDVPVNGINWLKNLKLSASGYNLFTFTDYSWFNPEANAYSNNNSAVGIDRNSYPLARTFIFSLRLTVK